MCGIYGIYQLDGSPADPRLLEPMGQATKHRGPDDQGSHADGNCAIGMRRLSIIDVAGGHQPLSDADGQLWVVCNGEIYNFRELRRELEADGYRFRTASDSEVLLHLYAAHGDAFVERLNGMFGFALWDARRRRLLIGRDRLGIKPMYLLIDGVRVAFASEAKALLTLPGVEARINPAAVDSYLSLGYVPTPQCLFDGIEKLPAATLLVLESRRASRRRYWSVPSTIDRTRSEAEWVDETRRRLQESVRLQMVSDVPIGAFLSGGIDSSAVVAFMAAASDQPIKTYSIGFEGGTAEALYNELPFARRVAEFFHTDHHEIVVKPDVVALLPRLIWHLDEPIADTAFVTTYLVSEFARRDVTVILSGVGGDELFGGYRRYLGDHYLNRIRHVPGWARRGIASLGSALPSDRHSAVLNRLRLARGFLASVDQSFEDRYRSYVEVFSRTEAEQLLLVKGNGRWDALTESFRAAVADDPLHRMMTVDMETQLPDDLLMLTDRMSMAASIECRVPLLDHELVEFAAQMPETTKVDHGRLKYAMKRSLKGILPDDILHRKKRGFGAPMGSWIKRELAPVVRHLLSAPAIEARGLFRHEAVADLIAAHAANRIDGTDRLLALLNLEVWSRVFLDRRRPEDVAAELADVTR
jgi:asparagine synthase (glutamine-hydrolysing)